MNPFRRHPVPQSVKIPARAEHPIDDRLARRIEAARAALPVNNVKRLIEPQPETVESFKPYDELTA